MISLPVLLVLGFAAYRGTQLVVYDSITDPIRDRITDRFANADGRKASVWGFVHALVNCPYCAGFWISVVTLAVYLSAAGSWGAAPWLLHGLEAFAVAGVQALANRWDDSRDRAS